MSKKLIAVVGQTASGKSALAMEMTKKFGGEIVCADSRTIYKGMDIGTAKPTEQDRKKIAHHLLNIVSPDERFNANQFKVMANNVIEKIHLKGKVPFMVGGTGLYINSVIYNFDFKKGANDNKLREDTLIIGLKIDKEELKKRIKTRVDSMIAMGLEQEVSTLSAKYGFEAPGMNAICYKEWEPYFAGRQSLDELKQKLYTHNWQYAKRQNTWFKRDSNINWTTSAEEASVLAQQFLIQ